MQRPPQPMIPAQYRPGTYGQPPPGQRQAAMARGPGQMMPHQQGHHPQQYAQQMAQRAHQHRAQAAQHNGMRSNAENEQQMREQQARNRVERPTDFTLPEGIEDVTLGDGASQYKRLRDFEKRLDALMMRKNVEYQEVIRRRSKQTRKMRIWISNTVEGQYWQTQSDGFEFSSENNATFKVRIHGQLHPDPPREDADLDGTSDIPVEHARTKFSHFFHKITVEYDQPKDLAPEGTTAVEWVKSQGYHPSDPDLPVNVDFDHLVFERKGDENVNLTINLYRDFSLEDGDESNAVYSISEDLREIVGESEATRDEVIEKLFDYIRTERLQQDDEARIIQCDERLRKIFNAPTIIFPHLPQMLLDPKFDLLQPLKPISLKYTVRTDEEFHGRDGAPPEPTVYDVIVPAEDLLRERLIQLREQNPDWAHDLLRIKELDRQLALLVQASHSHMARWKFFNSMQADPVNFLLKWASSQQRDLEIMGGDSATETGWTVDSINATEIGRALDSAPPGVSIPPGQLTSEQPIIRQNYNLPGDEFRRGGENSVWASQGVREAVQLRLARNSKFKGAEA